jgi:hypothetical protein
MKNVCIVWYPNFADPNHSPALVEKVISAPIDSPEVKEARKIYRLHKISTLEDFLANEIEKAYQLGKIFG